MRSHSLLSLLFLVGIARQAGAIPSDDLLNSLKPSADVNDFAGLLAPAERESLEARCRQLRERTGAQLAVVTLKSLEGGDVDDFAVKLFKRWGIGQKDKKNGLLLLVAIADRKARIEVGYDLEPIIPDALAGRIVDNQLKPHFRNQEYAAGLNEAVNALCDLVEKGEPADRAAPAGNNAGGFDRTGAILFLAAFVAVGAFIFGMGLGLPQGVPIVFGLVFGGASMLAGFVMAGAAAIAVHGVVGIACTALGWKLAKQGGGGPGTRRPWISSPSSWNWGDYSGSSGGGWSSGGGGFSQSWGGFGGGSSGGGGASGSW